MPRPADGPAGACAWVRERIDPLLDGELAASEEVALQDHLADCPACRSELALARSLQGALRDGLPPLTCPPEVSQQVLAIARREEAERARRPARGGLGARIRSGLADWFGGGGLLRPALAAVALAALLAAPFVYRSLLGPARPQAPAVATLPAAPAPGASGAQGASYSPEEIAEARDQARVVLAYVAAVGRDAGRAVQDDVFAEGIVRPTRRAVESLGTARIAEPRRTP